MNGFFCACCGYRTMKAPPPGNHDHCEICGWCDDLEQNSSPDLAVGYNPVSLRAARLNFERTGAAHDLLQDEVRAPRRDDAREPAWKAQLDQPVDPVVAARRHPPPQFYCPCCGYRTLEEMPPGTHDICDICYWEDDLVQFNDPDSPGGANTASLRKARLNFEKFGASDLRIKKHVRPPRPDEPRDPNWTKLT